MPGKLCLRPTTLLPHLTHRPTQLVSQTCRRIRLLSAGLGHPPIPPAAALSHRSPSLPSPPPCLGVRSESAVVISSPCHRGPSSLSESRAPAPALPRYRLH